MLYDEPDLPNATFPPYIRPWRRPASLARRRADPPGGLDPPVVPQPRSAAVARMVRRPAEAVRPDIVIPNLQYRGPTVPRLPTLLDVHFRSVFDARQLRPAARFSAELVHVTHGPGGGFRVEHAQRSACVHDAAGIVKDAILVHDPEAIERLGGAPQPVVAGRRARRLRRDIHGPLTEQKIELGCFRWRGLRGRPLLRDGQAGPQQRKGQRQEYYVAHGISLQRGERGLLDGILARRWRRSTGSSPNGRIGPLSGPSESCGCPGVHTLFRTCGAAFDSCSRGRRYGVCGSSSPSPPRGSPWRTPRWTPRCPSAPPRCWALPCGGSLGSTSGPSTCNSGSS